MRFLIALSLLISSLSFAGTPDFTKDLDDSLYVQTMKTAVAASWGIDKSTMTSTVTTIELGEKTYLTQLVLTSGTKAHTVTFKVSIETKGVSLYPLSAEELANLRATPMNFSVAGNWITQSKRFFSKGDLILTRTEELPASIDYEACGKLPAETPIFFTIKLNGTNHLSDIDLFAGTPDKILCFFANAHGLYTYDAVKKTLLLTDEASEMNVHFVDPTRMILSE